MLWSRGLAGLWRLENTALDGSGNGNHGIVTGAVYTAGLLGRCLSFNGTSDYVRMGPAIAFERTDPFTFATGVKRDRTGTAEYFISKQLDVPHFTGWRVQFLATDTILIQLVNHEGTANKLEVRSTETFTSTSAFYHVAATYDGSSTPAGVRLYADGKLLTNVTVTDGLTASILNAANLQMSGRGTTTRLFDGLIDEVCIWNRVLIESDIRRVMLGLPPIA